MKLTRECIKTGQVWKRVDGRQVRIGMKRNSRGDREFELIPLGKGRKSWKWDGAILYDLEFVSEG